MLYAEIVFYLSLFSSFIIFLRGSYSFRDKEVGLLVLLVGLSFLCDSLNAIWKLSKIFLAKGIWIPYVSLIYRLGELTLINLFCTFELKHKWKLIIFSTSILLVAWFLIRHADFSRSYVDSAPVSWISATICIPFSLAFYRRTLLDLEIPSLQQWPPFYTYSALFLYFCGSIFLLVLFRPIADIHPDSAHLLWSFHNFLVIFRNILLYKAFSLSKVSL